MLHDQPYFLRQQRQLHHCARRAGEALLHLRCAGALPGRNEAGGGRRRPPYTHDTQPAASAASATTREAEVCTGANAIATSAYAMVTSSKDMVPGASTRGCTTKTCRAQEAQEEALPT